MAWECESCGVRVRYAPGFASPEGPPNTWRDGTCLACLHERSRSGDDSERYEQVRADLRRGCGVQETIFANGAEAARVRAIREELQGRREIIERRPKQRPKRRPKPKPHVPGPEERKCAAEVRRRT